MQSDKRVALIVGCADYPIGCLNNPLRDANAVSQCFERLDFDHVTLVKNPSLVELGRKLADFAEAAADAEIAAIYFAGHGIEASGQNYLIPLDAELGHVRRLDFEAVKLSDIMRAIDNSRRHLRLVILDACRNNPYRQRMRGLDQQRSAESGLGWIEPRGNNLVAYAAEHGQPALDGDWGGNSPYASALLAHLETPDLEIRLLFGRVRDEVYRRTQEKQSPHLYGTLGGQEIYLKRKAEGAANPPPPPQQGSQLPQNGAVVERAAELWREFDIEGTGEPELIQAYIAQIEKEAPLWVFKARKRLEIVLAALSARDDAAWREATETNTEAAFLAYLKAWPSGSHTDQARQRAAQLAEAAAWETAFASDDIAALEAVLVSYPKSGRAMEARARVRQLEERDFVSKGFVKVEALGHGGKTERRWIAPGSGEGFKDFADGPEMVIVPSGEFMMGSTDEQIAALTKEYGDYFKREGPRHRVIIPQPFAIGRYAVTRGQFSAFVNATGHKTDGGAHVWIGSEWKLDPANSWRDPGFQQDDQHPVVCVNWHDATAYAVWLSKQTGKRYLLPSEAEWEYAARAGTQTRFWWGSSITPEQANYDGNYIFGGGPKGEYRQKTVPVKSFEANPWGLYQVHGNVWEWVEDGWHDSYAGKPETIKADGGVWTTPDGSARVLRGGSWYYFPQRLRSACRSGSAPGGRGSSIGFRVARTLSPL